MKKLCLPSLFTALVLTLYSVGALAAGVNTPGFQENQGEGPKSPPFLRGQVQVGGEPDAGWAVTLYAAGDF
jgi:hypothetical protein